MQLDAELPAEPRVLTVRRAVHGAGRALARDESGVTLVELLTASVLALIVIGAGVMVFTASIRSQPKASARSAQIQDARTTMERATREVRQATGLATGTVATAQQLSVLTYVKSATCGGSSASAATLCRVTYTCTAGICMRTERNPDGTGSAPAEQVVSGLSSSDVFGYEPPSSPDPDYITLTLAFPADGGDDAITLQDAVALRAPGAP